MLNEIEVKHVIGLGDTVIRNGIRQIDNPERDLAGMLFDNATFINNFYKNNLLENQDDSKATRYARYNN